MQRTAAAASTGSRERTSPAAPAAVQPEPKSMIAKLADARTVEEGLRLVMQIVSALGGAAERIALERSGHVTELGGKSKAAGVRRDIEGRFADVTLTVTCLGALPAELHAHLQTITSLAALSAERWVRRTCQPQAPSRNSDGMIGTGKRMAELNAEITRAARSGHSVLIYGESGTGKTTTASRIHKQSRRATGRFIDLNCATIPEALLESELFGHEKGAFTSATSTKKGLFEEAEGGTLFLDEVAEMKVELQAKLLKVLEQKKIRRVGGTKDVHCDVRIIAASSANLQERIRGGSFREDLYYRLAVLEIRAPALRERREDMPALIRHCLQQEQRAAGRARPFEIEEAAVRELVSYDWPGNIRQLQNIVARLTAVVEDRAAVITLEDVRAILAKLSDRPKAGAVAIRAEPQPEEGEILLPEEVRLLRAGESLQDFIERVQLVVIEAARDSEGNMTRAAARLAYRRTALLKLFKKVFSRRGNNRAASETERVVAA